MPKVILESLTQNDAQALADFLCAHPWPFHSGRNSIPEAILSSFKQGFYLGEYIESFWVLSEAQEKCGFIRLFDLEDETPVFDLRLGAHIRGKGYGTAALGALCNYVFSLPDKIRLEGHTRHDNRAMQRVFEKCYFVKEAQHRRTWPDPGSGKIYDSIGYGILKEDWLEKKTTPFADTK